MDTCTQTTYFSKGWFLANAGRVREESIDGIRYLVAPAVILVEGVHNGVLYPAEQLGRHVRAWNGIPLCINHPKNESGQYVSANEIGVWTDERMGWFFNAMYEAQLSRIRGEVWLDIERASRHPFGHEVMGKIRRGEALELSTGLSGDLLPEEGTWHGEPYQGVFTNYRPDHLALLPQEPGACSFADGCGVRVNEGKEKDVKEGQEGDKGPVAVAWKTALKETIALLYDVSHRDIREQLQALADGWDTGSKLHVVRDVFDDSFVYEAVGIQPDGSPGGRNMFRLGYTMDDKGVVSVANDPTEVVQRTEYVGLEAGPKGKGAEITNASPDTGDGGKGGEEESDMNGPTQEVKDRVRVLVACGETRFTDADTEWLSALSACQLDKLKPLEPEPVEPKSAEEVVANAPETFRERLSKGLEVLAANEKAEKTAHEEIVKTILENKRNKFSEEQLVAMDTGTLKTMAELLDAKPVNYGGSGGGGPVVTDVENAGEPKKAPTRMPVWDLGKKREPAQAK